MPPRRLDIFPEESFKGLIATLHTPPLRYLLNVCQFSKLAQVLCTVYWWRLKMQSSCFSFIEIWIYLEFSVRFEDGSIAIFTIQMDQRLKYFGKTFQSLCISNELHQDFSSIATAEDIDLAELLNRTLFENVGPMPLKSALPLTFRPFVIHQGKFLHKRCFHSSFKL